MDVFHSGIKENEIVNTLAKSADSYKYLIPHTDFHSIYKKVSKINTRTFNEFNDNKKGKTFSTIIIPPPNYYDLLSKSSS